LHQLLVPEPVQPGLFSDAEAAAAEALPTTERGERDALERTVDAVRARFGPGALGPAATRVEGAPPVRENGDA
jgi:hypothetical protein